MSYNLDAPGDGCRRPDEQLTDPAAAASLPDVLDYMADIILELRQMADRTPCQTLNGLLGLAHTEALIRREEAARAQVRRRAD